MSNPEVFYTPDTEEVGEAYANGVWNDGVGRSGPEVDTEFGRWLVAHDAAIRVSALEEAALIAEQVDLVDVALNGAVVITVAIRAAKGVAP